MDTSSAAPKDQNPGIVTVEMVGFAGCRMPPVVELEQVKGE